MTSTFQSAAPALAWVLLLALAAPAFAAAATAGAGSDAAVERLAADRILADADLDDVLGRARALLKTGLNAGSGYPEVWVRDWATFMDLSCEVVDHKTLRDGLLLILRFQREDGNIPDGVGHRDPPKDAEPATAPTTAPAGGPLVTQIAASREIITNPRVPEAVAFKNSVETDQESSLVQAVKIYVDRTGDRSILAEVVEGRTVLDRMVGAMEFLRRDRWSEKHGLIWGATTIDWGDLAPEDDPGAVLGDRSHRAIDVYDNAMFVLALDDLIPLLADRPAEAARWRAVRDGVAAACREHLWQPGRQKFIPHLYLGGSPFPADFDESAIWYHGGTAVAIQAGLLTDDEARASLQIMRLNVAAARGRTVGVTNYPTYPKGLFANDHVLPGQYQNGGDGDWFGGRMVQALAARGLGAEAYEILLPMVHRIQRHDGFFEWFDAEDRPQGSGTFRGSAGVLGKAIVALRDWARAEQARE